MPFPFSLYDEDPFAPEDGDEVDIADIDRQTSKYSTVEDPAYANNPLDVHPEWYDRGMLDAPEYWSNPSVLGQGVDRPKLQRPTSTEEELDLVQEAMAPRGPFERGDRPGRPSGEGGGGGFDPTRRISPPEGDRRPIVGYRLWDRVEKKYIGDMYGPGQGKRLRSRAHRLDNEYGAYRYSVDPIFGE